jgi:hypothetical protein
LTFLSASAFTFLFKATDVPMKTTDFAKGQGGYFNLQAKNTTDFNSISIDDNYGSPLF